MKHFGPAMVNAIEQAAFGGEPALEQERVEVTLTTSENEEFTENSSEIKWTEEALNYL